jgi:Ricin-type beta-trefoil lectin domain
MRNYRILILLFAAALVTATALAFISAANAEDAIVKLVSAENGKCLQPVNGSLHQGDAIVQEPCNGSVAQQWTVKSVSSTKVHLVNRASHFCLDARGKAVNGTPIQQWTCNRISNENWSFGITNNLLSSGISNTFSHCVSTPGDQDGLAMELRFCANTPAQHWSRPAG